MRQLKVNTENAIKSNMAETLTRVSQAMLEGSMHVFRNNAEYFQHVLRTVI
jgi:hypothetical protein